jgi:hypothetical protein
MRRAPEKLMHKKDNTEDRRIRLNNGIAKMLVTRRKEKVDALFRNH